MAGHHSADTAARLVGEWFHSHEEDVDGSVVYRPRSFAFPRARRPRTRLTLGADGHASLGSPGPADRTEQALARWSLSGDQVVVDVTGGPALRFRITEHAGTTLRLTTTPEGHDL